MKNIKGFINIPVLANNAEGQVAAFGELSTYAQTFSRTKGNYVDATKPNVELTTFRSTGNAGTYEIVAAPIALHILTVAQWVYDQYNSNLIPLDADRATFIANVQAAFATVQSLEAGLLLPGSGATLNMPEFLSWTYNDGTDDHQIKIWFADASFRAQYDEYEILVIPPLDPVDNLNGETAIVNPQLAAVTYDQRLTAIAAVQGTNPPTMVKTKALTWHDPTLPVSTLPTVWTLVIYGEAGNNNDLIKEAIKQYIADNSLLTVGVWDDIYPDLYAENEFIVMPLWENLAVPGNALDYGIYSPVVNPGEMKALATVLVPDQFTNQVVIGTYLDLYLNVASTFWRSMSFLMVGNPGNTGGIHSLKQKYPDYINVATDSPDFARMNASTAGFVAKLVDALEKAMVMTPASSVPAGYSRVVRDGDKLFLVFEHEGTNFLILTKHSYTLLTP